MSRRRIKKITLKNGAKVLASRVQDVVPRKIRKQRGIMQQAYCSYQDCGNKKIHNVAVAGMVCDSCGRPLSWAGIEKVKNEAGKLVKQLRRPFGKWSNRRFQPATA